MTKKQVRADEMADLSLLLSSIGEVLNDAYIAAAELSQTGFYEAGMAQDKFDVYPIAFGKVSDLMQHYQRIADLVEFTNQEFAETDRYIASKVNDVSYEQGKGGRIL